MTDRQSRTTGAQWARPLSPEERAAELEHHERLITRDVRRAFGFALLGCAFWLLVGLALMGWSLHTTDRGLGEIAFLGGLVVAYAGLAVTLARYYLHGEAAGWW